MLKRAGLFFLVMGVGSFILPFAGIQFRLVQALGDTPLVSFGLIGLGLLLVIVGFAVESTGRPPAAIPAAPPVQPGVAYTGTPVPPRASTPMPPPTTRLADDRFAQRCPTCGDMEPLSSRFCGSCGTNLPSNVSHTTPPPPVPKRSSALAIVLVVCALLFVGAVAVVGIVGWWVYSGTPVADSSAMPNPLVRNVPINVELDDGRNNTSHSTVGIARPEVRGGSVEGYLADAATCLASGNARGTVSILTTALSYHPGNAELLTARANANQWNADYTASLADYRDAAAKQPGNLSLRCEVVRLRLIAEPPLNAFPEVQTLVQQHPRDPDVVLLTTQAYLWCNDVNAAGPWIAYLKQIDPNAAEKIFASGRGWVDGGALLRGVFDLSTAVWLDPEQADAYYHLGRAREGLGHHQPAIAAYSRYLEYAPNGPYASDARAKLR